MSIRYVLSYFQQNFDDPASTDIVRTTVRIYSDDVPVGGRDISLSSVVLTVQAEAQGHQTWDEFDVAQALGEKLGAIVYIAEPTEQQPTPEMEEPAGLTFTEAEPARPSAWVRLVRWLKGT